MNDNTEISDNDFGGAKWEINKERTEYYKGSVKNVDFKIYSVKYINGKAEKQSLHKKNRISRGLNYLIRSSKSGFDLSFNQKGEMIEVEYYEVSDTILTEKHKFEYHKGKWIRQEVYRFSKFLTDVLVRELDDSMKTRRLLLYSPQSHSKYGENYPSDDGLLLATKRSFQYNANGDLEREKTIRYYYNKDSIAKYPSELNLEPKYSNGKLLRDNKWCYLYKNGKLYKKQSCTNNSTDKTSIASILINNDIDQTMYFNEVGNLIESVIAVGVGERYIEFDDDGYIQRYYDNVDKLMISYKYDQLDKNGNWTRVEQLDMNGRILSIGERKISYYE
ncbi:MULTISPECIES: hypothetical protein [Flavobacteriaceae]|uniref:hypothetical protein n=1 Tax=Flavobacteriaceae TaxID=49546 RepID=UPI001491FE15|nr:MULTISPECIES: hypothetical protein [Allomuricauda]MDC6364828.1 hypothetical protein [Muricauda sp. AC10]